MPDTFDIGAIGQGAAAQGVGAILGIGLGAYNDNRQEIQNRRLMNQQAAMQKSLTDYNMSKQLEMWKATSYPAQIEQMKKAGINPGLLYGMGGGGGQTANIAQGNISSATAQQNPGEAQAMAGMGIQAGLQAAQIELMKAEALKARTEAAKTGGVDTTKTVAETGLVNTQTGNVKMDTELKKTQNELMGIQKEIQGATIEEQIRIISQEASKLDEEVMQMGVKTNIDRATMSDIIDQIHANMIGAFLENNLRKAMTGKTEQEITTMKQEILQKWKDLQLKNRGLDQNAQDVETRKFAAEMQSAYPSIWGVMGNSLQTLTRTIDSRRPTFQVPKPKL